MPIITTRAIYFPYCINQQEDKSWVILNRNYEPLGQGRDNNKDSNIVDADLCIAKITPKQAEKLSFDGSNNNTGRIYLYNDGCLPTMNKKSYDAYSERLAVLIKLKTVAQLKHQ